MNIKLNCTCNLAKHMRGFVPEPGTDYRKCILVKLEPGESVAEHQHKGGVVLYYPADAAPVSFEPLAGTMIFLPANTKHKVAPVDAARVSIAMVVDNAP